MKDTQHLEAIVLLAERELATAEWYDRGGVFRALLDGAMPYLRETLAARLRVRLAEEEDGNTERSDPAANADSDAEIAVLKARIAELEATT